MRKTDEVVNVGTGRIEQVVAKARNEHGVDQLARLRDANGFSIQPCAFAGLSTEVLLHRRVGDDPKLELALMSVPHGDGILGQSMSIVERAVDWIDEPLVIIVAYMLTGLFSVDAMTREVRLDLLDHKSFDGRIRRGDEIRLALVPHLKTLIAHLLRHTSRFFYPANHLL